MVRPGRSNPFSTAAALEAAAGDLHEDLAVANHNLRAAAKPNPSDDGSPSSSPTCLTADTIVSNLRARAANGDTCTRVGARCVVSLASSTGAGAGAGAGAAGRENNMEEVSKAHAARARSTDKGKWTAQTDVPVPNVSVMDIAASAYFHMLRGQEDQSILLLGETGSGKTESLKLLTRNLIDLSKTTKKKTKTASSILRADSILSALGSAVTPVNRSSSCFSRYVEYQFDNRGRMVGAKFIDYLLDTRRVTGPDDAGRNLNVFYHLLQGATAEEKQQLQLGDPAHYHYLSIASSSRLTSPDDATGLASLRDSLKHLGVGRRQQAQLFQLWAAILHLGNVTFQDDDHASDEPCSVKNYNQMALVADLLGVHPASLEAAMTYKTQVIRRDVVSVFLDAKAACEQRDALARSLYAVAFSYVVERVNDKLCRAENEWAHFVAALDLQGFSSGGAPVAFGASPASKRRSGGVAAMADGVVNGLHRLLVNYANDRLAGFTAHQLFGLPREVLTAEGLSSVAPGDSGVDTGVLELLSSVDGLKGILPTLEAEAVKATKDSKTTEKLHADFGSDAAFVQLATKRRHAFAIRHVGGTVVEYETKGWADRNTDVLQSDFVNLIRGSPEQAGTSSAFLRGLFSDRMIATMTR
ncbi:hypothetical protein HK101_004651, partial [Irineochytrium annulatum]